MNTSIIQQYREFRQSGSLDLLYQIADQLDLLGSFERHIRGIPYSRHGSMLRQIESRLDSPEETVAKAIYRRFYESGIQAQCYELKIADSALAAYCEARSRLYWAGKLTQEEWDFVHSVEDSGISSDPGLEKSISAALEQYLSQLEIREAV